VNLHARLLRTGEELNPGDLKTKVRYGSHDFCLLKKSRNSGWTVVNIDKSKLPPLEYNSSIRPLSSSPPPGRPSHHALTSRKRGASFSPTDATKKPSKVINQEDPISSLSLETPLNLALTDKGTTKAVLSFSEKQNSSHPPNEELSTNDTLSVDEAPNNASSLNL